jgi:hypothetical protein
MFFHDRAIRPDLLVSALLVSALMQGEAVLVGAPQWSAARRP